ncbi:hypothetical protein JGK42_000822 [Aeromonas veronii]|nr:hypothetical protein [Aeromonas veronii]
MAFAMDEIGLCCRKLTVNDVIINAVQRVSFPNEASSKKIALPVNWYVADVNIFDLAAPYSHDIPMTLYSALVIPLI